jgi:hypothetical protein
MSWLSIFRRPRTPAVFVRAWKPMTPEQTALVFAHWPETDDRWRAMWDMLSAMLESELAGGESIKPDPHEILQWSGRLQMLLYLRGQLLALQSNPDSSR